jgi:hypothetical protein
MLFTGKYYCVMQLFHSSNSFPYRPILDLLKDRKYAAILVVSGIAYAFVYMMVVGIISYVPDLLSSASGMPVFRITSLGISAIPVDNVFFFIFYGAFVFLAASSFLVGLNISLMIYFRRVARACSAKRTEPKGLLGVVPAFFTSFSCCGGGLLVLAIGPVAFSSLSLYSQYMAPLTVAALAAGTYFISNKLNRCC